MDKLHFVVHLHKATSLHYDLRFEVRGVMPSWPVPKGPTLDPTVKRLALKTEDHPLDYRHFEGVIPEGQYGSSPVIIWDEGYYYPELEMPDKTREAITDKAPAEKIMEDSIKKGEIKFQLYGHKLKGSFALIKMKNGVYPERSRSAWLLIKHKDKFAKIGWDAKDYPKSVVSNKTIEQIT